MSVPRPLSCVPVFAALACAITPVAAQQPDTVRLPAIIVTANRLSVAAAAVANAATVLEGDELRARGVTHVVDALRDVPGVALAQAGGYGTAVSLFMRGGESDHVKVLVDGVAINQPGGFLNLADLRTDDVERIEIVRGPASVVYGSDAMSGVIQIFTRRGGTRPRIAAGGRRAGTLSSAVDIGASVGGARGDLAADASRFVSDGAHRFNSRYRAADGGLAARVRPDARTDLLLTLRLRDAVLHFPTDGGGNVVDSNQFQLSRRTALAVDAGRRIGRAELRGQVAVHWMVDDFDNQPDSPGDTAGFYAFQSHAALTRHSADVRITAPLGGALVSAGAVFERQGETGWTRTWSSFSGADTGEVDVARYNRGYYAQLVRAAGRLAVNAGVRVDDNQAFGRFTTGRAGVTYRMPGGARLRAAVGNAFKEPTFIENYANGFAIGNPALRPERSRTWEAGAELPLLGGRVVPAVTWFDQRYRDLIQYTDAAPGPGDPNFYNVAKAKASGLEVELRATLLRRWNVAASYSWVRTVAVDSGFDGATFAAGRRLLRRPEHSAALTLTHTFRPRGSASVTVRAVGSRDDIDFTTIPSSRVELAPYRLIDATLLVPCGPFIDVILRGENLADTRYADVLHFGARRHTVWVGLRAGN